MRKLGSFPRNALLYFSYHCLIWAIHACVLSLMAFFHFLLDHRLQMIENWVFHKAWEIIALTKLLTTYLIIKFLTLKTDERHPFKFYLSKGLIFPNKEVVAVTILFFIFTLILGMPQVKPSVKIEWIKMIIQFVSIFLFYMTDLIVIGMGNRRFSLSGKEKIVQLFVFPILFFVMGKMSFVYGRDIGFFLYPYFLFCLFLNGRSNWPLPAFFILLYICPIGVFFGMDPIWGDTHSLFQMKTPLLGFYFFILTFMFMGYLLWKSDAGRKKE